MPPGPVNDIDVADVVSFAPHQCRQEAVQPVEIGQRQEQVAAKRLEAAAGVPGAILEDRAAHRVGDARLPALEAGRLAADALAGDETDVWGALFQRSEKGRNKGRVVLAIAVERNDDGGAR